MKKKKPFKQKKPQSLEKSFESILLEYLGGKRYLPQTEEALITTLKVLPEQKATFKQVLASLEQEKKIICHEKQYSLSLENLTTLQGQILINPRGFGFVQPTSTEGAFQEVFIPKPFVHGAIDQDLVEVAILKEATEDKSPEGKVIQIIRRHKKEFLAVVQSSNKKETCLFISQISHMPNALLQEENTLLKKGDRILVKIIQWSNGQTPHLAEMIQNIGSIDDPYHDIACAIAEYTIPNAFSKTVLNEVKKIPTTIEVENFKNRKDFTGLSCLTIDPDSAKDFDDALSIEKDSLGNFVLGVHIADVSHYVKEGTALDEEAALRANSTYFPNECIPMLPKELSDELCSLKPHVNRLAISVMMRFDTNAHLVSYEIVKSIIKSQHRFTYKEAFAVIEGKKENFFQKDLLLLVELALKLKQIRANRGSIDLSLPEVILKVNEKGMPYGTELIEYDISHQAVEEFMLKANEVVAIHLDKEKSPLPFRVHDKPFEDNFRYFAQIASTFGYDISSHPTLEEIKKVIESVQNPNHLKHLSIKFIRMMKLASYSSDNIGHFGLNLEHYCHFTSPIRRYCDLIVHRCLFEKKASKAEIEKISLYCSEKERNSAKAEMSVLNLKKIRYAQMLYEKDRHTLFEGVICHINPFGISFEINDIMLEGFLSLQDIEDDYYFFQEETRQLTGRRTKKLISLGDPIEVTLKKIDLIEQRLEWKLMSIKRQHKVSLTKKLKNNSKKAKKTKKRH